MAIQDALPDRLGPYRLLDRLGEGGMGVVHLAADAENRRVAVKVLRPQVAGDATARRRLAREVETMRRVRSRLVAEVIDADVTGPVPYIVTRYVPGRTLEQVVEDRGPLRGLPLQRLACGLAGALAAVHAAGVVHRDLKPGNVMMVGDDPVVIDFGIAQAGDTTRLTETGMFVGTPGYLAPEVIEGKPSGQGADVHSWAATVAFAATGKPPYGTGTYEVVFFRILHGSPDLGGLPVPMYPLVAAALTREPGRRPSAAWLAAQVAALDLTAPAPAWQGAPAAAGSAGGGSRLVGGADAAAARGGGAGAAAYGGGAGAAAYGGRAGRRARGRRARGRRAALGAASPSPMAAAPLRGAGRSAGSGPGLSGAGASGAAGAAGATGDRGYETSGEVADLLPPVHYPPPRDVPHGRPQAGQPQGWAHGPAAQQSARWPVQGPAEPGGYAAQPGQPAPAPRRHRTLTLAILVMAVGISVILPVAGTALVLALIAVFRAGDRAQRGLAARRGTRGPRPTDALVVVLSAPWALARSILLTMLVAPLLLFIAAVAAVALIVVMRGSQMLVVGAYAAGVFAALNCLGPGSRAPRRQLNRLFNAIAPTRLAAVAATIVLGALAAAFVSLAMIKAPVYWPAPDPHSLFGQVPGAGLFHAAVLRLRHAGLG
jgi:Protein kinase domain